MVILFLFILFTLSWLLIGCFRIYALKKDLVDKPNHRSSHTITTPRGAGIVFMILWLTAVITSYCFGYINIDKLLILLPGSILIGVISYLDDCRGMSAKLRLIIQFAAAIISLIALGGYLGWLGSVLAAIAIIWSVNLYNFMDGIDGIAAVEALFVFGIGGFLIWRAGGQELAVLLWGMGTIVAGFLLWNFPPAKIFMGDSGSALLGFLTVIFALMGVIFYKVPIFLWAIIYGVFWFDATVTLIRRIVHREVWYKAHRLHAYQRLQLQGWSHSQILLGVVIINILLSSLTIWADYFPNYLLGALSIALIVLISSYFLVEIVQPMYKGEEKIT
jgi:Fuc2NAc and GlcNAc transferase